MEENDLFLFDWKVDQEGYDLEFFQPPPLAPGIPVTVLSEVATEPYWIIKPRGGPLHYYRPLKDHPGLARRFADLAQTPGDNAALVDLANTFGLLTVAKTGRVSEWWGIIHSLHVFFSMKDADDIEGACAAFNRHVRSRFSATIRYERAKRPELELSPFNLAGALWFQAAGELTHGTTFKRCRVCPTWFPVGRGTKHRKTRKFCSDRCRKTWHRKQKRETAK